MRHITKPIILRAIRILAFFFSHVVMVAAANASSTNIFAPESTPAQSIFNLSMFVLAIVGIVFVVVFILLVYSISKFRATTEDAGREPAQVYGSTQIELAWTIIPILIVVILFLATARVIHAVQDAPEPALRQVDGAHGGDGDGHDQRGGDCRDGDHGRQAERDPAERPDAG